MQFQSDLTGIEIRRPAYKELTSLGTYYLTAIGAGILTDIREIKEKVKYERIFYPDSDKNLLNYYKLWEEAVKYTIEWNKKQNTVNL